MKVWDPDPSCNRHTDHDYKRTTFSKGELLEQSCDNIATFKYKRQVHSMTKVKVGLHKMRHEKLV